MNRLAIIVVLCFGVVCGEKAVGGLQEWLANVRAVRPPSSGGLAGLIRTPGDDKAFQVVSVPLSIKNNGQPTPSQTFSSQTLQQVPPQPLFSPTGQPSSSQVTQAPTFLGYGNPGIYYFPVVLPSYPQWGAFPVDPVYQSPGSWSSGVMSPGYRGQFGGYMNSPCSLNLDVRSAFRTALPYQGYSPFVW